MKTVRAVIEKINPEFALLSIGQDRYKLEVPLKYLPDNVKENMELCIGFKLEEEEVKRHLKRIKQFIKKLEE